MRELSRPDIKITEKFLVDDQLHGVRRNGLLRMSLYGHTLELGVETEGLSIIFSYSSMSANLQR